MKLTFKEKKQVFKIGLKIGDIIQNIPTMLQEMAFNQLKTEYAEKVITGNFNLTLYEEIFINRSIEDWKKELSN